MEIGLPGDDIAAIVAGPDMNFRWDSSRERGALEPRGKLGCAEWHVGRGKGGHGG